MGKRASSMILKQLEPAVFYTALDKFHFTRRWYNRLGYFGISLFFITFIAAAILILLFPPHYPVIAFSFLVFTAVCAAYALKRIINFFTRINRISTINRIWSKENPQERAKLWIKFCNKYTYFNDEKLIEQFEAKKGKCKRLDIKSTHASVLNGRVGDPVAAPGSSPPKTNETEAQPQPEDPTDQEDPIAGVLIINLDGVFMLEEKRITGDIDKNALSGGMSTVRRLIELRDAGYKIVICSTRSEAYTNKSIFNIQCDYPRLPDPDYVVWQDENNPNKTPQYEIIKSHFKVNASDCYVFNNDPSIIESAQKEGFNTFHIDKDDYPLLQALAKVEDLHLRSDTGFPAP